METKPRLIIAPGKEKALQRRHPWVFSGAMRRIVGNPQDGDLVDIVDSRGQWLATGHFQADESIICKVLSFDTQQVDEAFFRHLFESAVGYRKRLGFSFSLMPLEPLTPLTVSLVRFLRPERRFASIDELRRQISADVFSASHFPPNSL